MPDQQEEKIEPAGHQTHQEEDDTGEVVKRNVELPTDTVAESRGKDKEHLSLQSPGEETVKEGDISTEETEKNDEVSSKVTGETLPLTGSGDEHHGTPPGEEIEPAGNAEAPSTPAENAKEVIIEEVERVEDGVLHFVGLGERSEAAEALSVHKEQTQADAQPIEIIPVPEIVDAQPIETEQGLEIADAGLTEVEETPQTLNTEVGDSSSETVGEEMGSENDTIERTSSVEKKAKAKHSPGLFGRVGSGVLALVGRGGRSAREGGSSDQERATEVNKIAQAGNSSKAPITEGEKSKSPAPSTVDEPPANVGDIQTQPTSNSASEPASEFEEHPKSFFGVVLKPVSKTLVRSLSEPDGKDKSLRTSLEFDRFRSFSISPEVRGVASVQNTSREKETLGGMSSEERKDVQEEASQKPVLTGEEAAIQSSTSFEDGKHGPELIAEVQDKESPGSAQDVREPKEIVTTVPDTTVEEGIVKPEASNLKSNPSLSVHITQQERSQKISDAEESPKTPTGPEYRIATTPRNTPLMRRVEQLEQKLAQLESRQSPMSPDVASTGPSTPRSSFDRLSRSSARHVLEETGSKGSILERVATLEQKFAYLSSNATIAEHESTPPVQTAATEQSNTNGHPDTAEVELQTTTSNKSTEGNPQEQNTAQNPVKLNSEEASKAIEDKYKHLEEEGGPQTKVNKGNKCCKRRQDVTLTSSTSCLLKLEILFDFHPYDHLCIACGLRLDHSFGERLFANTHSSAQSNLGVLAQIDSLLICKRNFNLLNLIIAGSNRLNKV